METSIQFIPTTGKEYSKITPSAKVKTLVWSNSFDDMIALRNGNCFDPRDEITIEEARKEQARFNKISKFFRRLKPNREYNFPKSPVYSISFFSHLTVFAQKTVEHDMIIKTNPIRIPFITASFFHHYEKKLNYVTCELGITYPFNPWLIIHKSCGISSALPSYEYELNNESLLDALKNMNAVIGKGFPEKIDAKTHLQKLGEFIMPDSLKKSGYEVFVEYGISDLPEHLKE